MVSLLEVARKANCSKSSVSRVLSGNSSSSIRISEATRARILAAAKELGYQPNRTAEFLRRGFTPVIGIFLPGYRNGLCMDLVRSTSEAAAAHHFSCSYHFGFSPEEYRQFLSWTAGQRECGLVTYPQFSSNAEVAALLRNYLDSGGKLVQLSSITPLADFPESQVPYVICDDVRGGEIAGERLLTHHCDTYVALYGDQFRGAGFRKAITGAGQRLLQLDADENGLQTLLQYCRRKKKTTGVFCMRSEDALQLYALLLQNGILPGDNVKLIAYDNILPEQALPRSLTTIVQPFVQAGKLAVEKLVIRIFGGETSSERLAPTLMEGETA